MSFLSRAVSLPLWLVVVAVFLFVGLIVVIWSLKRRRDAKFHFQSDVSFTELIPSVVGATHASLIDGNEVEVLENGRFFDALFEELRGASKSITIEAFLWKPGEISRKVVEILVQKSRDGVAVRMLLDGSGGKIASEEERSLRDAGCIVHAYHPVRISNIGSLNNRDHRKIVVVDGRVGFVGGHCITDDWQGDAGNEKEFRDISVRLRGPIVGELQSAFLENWIEETGDVLLGEAFFPKLKPCGDVPGHLVYVSPANRTSSVELLHYVAIRLARKSVLIQNPYFLPDPEMIDALTEAVKRGVDVRVMLPAAEVTDSPIVQHASHHRFGALLESGVRIFEYQRSLLHQKVMTIDGSWVSVGSCNFDDRSFELNDEVTLGMVSEELATKFKAIFEKDAKFCKELSAGEWKKRSVVHRLKDFGAFAVNEQL